MLCDCPHHDFIEFAPAGNTGDELSAAHSAGVAIEGGTRTGGFWAPVSRSPLRGAELAGHFHDRQQPGFLAVARDGRRFANEAASNHDFAQAIVRAAGPGEEPVAYMVCDSRSIRRVGLGDFIDPWPASLAPHLRSAT
ncbi:FAD-binding protein [Verminephrobacter eiseniae]|uniref:FAD-binding protein n=1 Tax=Verminephrobacter eiseniae TaxID=364317 RepID=UPI0022370459|nr:FAD-binding protein [Verminephrobacter eiseniae]